ncbi:hypothetical protein AC579_2686 [Pseudocercospora musae]|uniref:GLEYA adhesin domain-containing protein n=1 Tax=Pseudocercospora musae TaxID=113226 RepID=A0A139IV98_9PEZI|nr:hypothetical protein AC579_2686 [Pseudocercospora musae]
MKRGGTYPVLFTGVTSSAGGFSCSQGQTTTLYGRGIEFSCEQYSIMHRAYLVAPYGGQYVFYASNVDDDFAFWYREEAYTGFDDSNTMFRAPYQDSSGPGQGLTTWYLQPGDYMPMRIAFGNAYGGSSFNFTIELGNGTGLVQSLFASQYVVQYACNSAEGAPFPYDFGDEV